MLAAAAHRRERRLAARVLPIVDPSVDGGSPITCASISRSGELSAMQYRSSAMPIWASLMPTTKSRPNSPCKLPKKHAIASTSANHPAGSVPGSGKCRLRPRSQQGMSSGSVQLASASGCWLTTHASPATQPLASTNARSLASRASAMSSRSEPKRKACGGAWANLYMAITHSMAKQPFRVRIKPIAAQATIAMKANGKVAE